MRRRGVALFERDMRPDANSRDTWWRDYQAGLFHRGLLRLRNPVRWAAALARYFRAAANRSIRWATLQLQNARAIWSRPAAESSGNAPATRRTSDILTFEQRGEDFALVRLQADGSRAEIILTAANVVHLGLLAPGYARQILTDKVGQQPGTVAKLVRHTAMNANLRIIEILLTILDRGGARLDFPTTERRARALASKLVERADRIAQTPKPAKELR
jgi:hypothetical protein